MVIRGLNSAHKNWSSLCALTPSPASLKIMTLKPPLTPRYSSKFHRYDNYDKAPYIVSSNP